MGVTGLWKLIEQSGKPVPVETLENKVLAVGKCRSAAVFRANASSLSLSKQIYPYGCIRW